MAKRTPEQELKKRRKDCWKAVDETLKKYKCALHVEMIVSQFGNRPMIDIVPLKEKEKNEKKDK